MSNQNYDCIIVGQGLAGTCLSFEFIRRNKRILVIDRDAGAKCTAVAAGTFNPLVFKSFTPTWMAPVLLPYLKSFYGELGLFLGLSIFNNRSVVKSMKSEDQRRLWMVKTDDEVSGQFMRDDIAENVNGLHSDYGFGFVEKSGNIQVPLVMEGIRNKLKEDGNHLSEPFDFESLMISETGIDYKGYKAEHIIFCQGHENVQNPFFKELPFIPAKGEILIIESTELKSSDIIHDRINIVPMENDTYWVGSTFSWDKLDLEKTEAGRTNLESQLHQILQVPFKVLEHKVGIRPTVKDRRPLIGMHSEHSRLGIFNGLGTRGIMLAPYFANHFVEHIYNGIKLNREVDISRFSAKG